MEIAGNRYGRTGQGRAAGIDHRYPAIHYHRCRGGIVAGAKGTAATAGGQDGLIDDCHRQTDGRTALAVTIVDDDLNSAGGGIGRDGAVAVTQRGQQGGDTAEGRIVVQCHDQVVAVHAVTIAGDRADGHAADRYRAADRRAAAQGYRAARINAQYIFSCVPVARDVRGDIAAAEVG